MPPIDVVDRADSQPATRTALPDPGEQVPKLAWPTVALFLAGAVAFVASTVAYLVGAAPTWVPIVVNAVVTFTMFTVLHDAVHYAISSTRWVNGLVGRFAVLFVQPMISFPSFGFIHIEHHRHSNDDENDPDTFASHGPVWQLPFRWAVLDVFYGGYLIRKIRSRPKAEIAETLVCATLSVVGLIAAIMSGHFWTLAVVFIIPQRIAVVVLSWWFDWMPHHGLEDTQRSDRYRATRARVGMEWLYTPLMLSQNYHLVHHLHPSVPFYRYTKTWRRNEEAYLDRNSAISTVFGQELDSDEFREWKQLNGKLGRLLPVRMPARSSSPHAVFHRIPVAAVDPITADSTLVTFAVPEALQDQFRFEPGQHVSVRTNLGGEGVRRSYSICAPATRAQLRIAVKHIPGGTFSGFVADQLKAGDVLEVMTPAGSFSSALHPLHRKHYVGLVAGSGITPVLSILATVMELETESRFTLIYGNRDKESTMFRVELDRLESRYADRLEIRHVLSSEPRHIPELSGRIDAERLTRWLTTDFVPTRWTSGSCAARLGCPPVHTRRWSSMAWTRSASTSSCSRASTAPMRLRVTTSLQPSPCNCPEGNRLLTYAPATRSWKAHCKQVAAHRTPAWVARAVPAGPNCSLAQSTWTRISPLGAATSTPATSSPASRIRPARLCRSTTTPDGSRRVDPAPTHTATRCFAPRLQGQRAQGNWPTR